jgi:hypothetical protein
VATTRDEGAASAATAAAADAFLPTGLAAGRPGPAMPRSAPHRPGRVGTEGAGLNRVATTRDEGAAAAVARRSAAGPAISAGQRSESGAAIAFPCSIIACVTRC